jgi:hypothetical protein
MEFVKLIAHGDRVRCCGLRHSRGKQHGRGKGCGRASRGDKSIIVVIGGGETVVVLPSKMRATDRGSLVIKHQVIACFSPGWGGGGGRGTAVAGEISSMLVGGLDVIVVM